MTQDTIKETRVCKACSKEYEATIRNLLGIRFLVGEGRCPDCVKKMLEEETAREKQAEQARIISQRREWRSTSGIPPKFMNEDFGTFEKQRQAKAYEKCLKYADDFPLTNTRGYPSLILFSNESWGVGKTHLACAIAHRILDRWNGEDITCPLRFISEPDLLMGITATYNFSPEEKIYRESEADIINDHIQVPLLIMDDVGKRRVHDPRFVQRIMFALIDGRYRAMKPMVMTANLSPERLKLYLGGGQGDEASFDRIREMSQNEFIRLEGDSYRWGATGGSKRQSRVKED